MNKTDLTSWKFSIKALNFSENITLPHTWNVSSCKSVQLYRGIAEYETSFTCSNRGSRTAVLYFGCAYHTANVYVNSHLAGVHTGSGYTPFEFDITDFLVSGENTVKVTVENQSKDDMLPHALDFDWVDDGGLLRNVSLIFYDETDVRDIGVSYDISISGMQCSGVLNLCVRCVPQQLQFELIDFQSGKTVLSQSLFGSGTVSIPFKNLYTWEPEHPNLYLIKVNGCEKRIGFRTIEVRGGDVLLNGKKIFMKGCEWMPGSHPDYGMAEPYAHSIMRLEQLKAAGCTFTRFHWQQDSSVFDWCDEHGLLVQEEIPYWGYPKRSTPLQLALAKSQADEMLRYHSHHPSIICWGVGNELGGEFPETIDYVKQMYRYFKSFDKSRLVNYVSNSVSRDENINLDDATLYGDIAMWNEYLGLWQPCSDIEGVIRRTYHKFGNMPSMVTEFGLCEPAFDGGDERRTQILLERIPVYKSLPNMCGYVWFSLNDYRTHCGEAGEGKLKQRIHGSTDLTGNEKPSYAVFCKL